MRCFLRRPSVWRRSAGAALLFVLALGSGAWWWRGRPERDLAAAEEALRDGDPDAALAWLPIPESTPKTRDRAALVRARVAVERTDLAEAVRALDKVSHDGRGSADYAFWKGRTYFAARQSRLASAWFETALARRPGDADAYRWLGSSAYELGDRATAVRALEAVTRLDPKDPRVWRTLGLIFKENVEHEQARVAFEKSLALDRTQPSVRLELAETLLKLGDLPGAERELAACKGRVAEPPRAELLAECRRLLGDTPGHRAAVEAGLAASPGHPGLLAQRARIDMAEGHIAEALESLNRAIGSDPYRAETIYQRGVVLRQLGEDARAEQDFARATLINKNIAELSALNDQAAREPADADVRYRLGLLCVALGKPELAASWYRAALACDPKHPAARIGLNALRPR